MIQPAYESQLPPVLTISLLAQVLGVSTRQVNRLRKRKGWAFEQLPGMGDHPRWSRDQVLAVVRAGGRKRG